MVQRGGDWAGPQPAQTPHRCTKCNSHPSTAHFFSAVCGSISVRTPPRGSHMVRSMVNFPRRDLSYCKKMEQLRPGGVLSRGLPSTQHACIQQKDVKQNEIINTRRHGTAKITTPHCMVLPSSEFNGMIRMVRGGNPLGIIAPRSLPS